MRLAGAAGLSRKLFALQVGRTMITLCKLNETPLEAFEGS